MCLGAVGDPDGYYEAVRVKTWWCFPFVLVGVRACVRFWVDLHADFGAGLGGVLVSVSGGSP